MFSYGLYVVLLYVGLGIPIATFLALVAGVCLSFATQGKFVFGIVSVGSFIRFLASWSALYGLFLAVVLGLERFGISPYLGGLVATAINVIISFFVLRGFVFKRPDTDRNESNLRKKGC